VATATFSWIPQRTFVETWEHPVTIVEAGAGPEDFPHRVTANFRRSWELEFGPLDRATVNSIVAFYDARRGPWEAFYWTNPNDGVQRLGGFGGAISRAHLIGEL